MSKNQHPLRSALIALVSLALGSAVLGVTAGFLYGILHRFFRLGEGVWSFM